jgi:hypothetical protein
VAGAGSIEEQASEREERSLLLLLLICVKSGQGRERSEQAEKGAAAIRLR